MPRGTDLTVGLRICTPLARHWGHFKSVFLETFVMHVDIFCRQQGFGHSVTRTFRLIGCGFALIACMLISVGAVTAQPVLINTTLPDAIYGVPYVANVIVGGNPAPGVVTVAGLPVGLTATHNLSGSLSITGTSTGLGTFSVTITATNGTGTSVSTILLTVLRYSNVVKLVSAGTYHTCAVVNGGVKCWGFNDSGQLGDPTVNDPDSHIPVDAIATNSGAEAVTAGTFHSCAAVGGGAKCWGSNNAGQLGVDTGATLNSHAPLEVIRPSNNVTAVAAGNEHSCAVVDAGVKCWGANGSGQLGNNANIGGYLPVQAIPPSSNATAVVTGVLHTCALVAGGVQCWGANAFGQLGNGNAIESHVPVSAIPLANGVMAIASGYFHVCAVINGGVKCWGSNNKGQLGNNSTTLSSLPIDVIAANSNATSVATGDNHSCAVVDGGVKCWGNNDDSQLGNRSTVQSLTPVQAIVAGSGVTSIVAGARRTCAVVNGGVQCWGYDGEGQLGNNRTTKSLVPAPVVPTGSGLSKVATGIDHSCAIVAGGVKCWGANTYGQLGDNSTAQALFPVQAIVAGSDVTAIAAGDSFTCAAVAGGVKCWGINTNHQLGNGSTLPSLVPIQTVAPGSGVTAIAAGAAHSCAIVSGVLKCWGANGNGQLGNNTTTEGASPDSTALPNGSVGVTAGGAHTCAIANGGVQCWGANDMGQLGNSSTTQSSVPVIAIAAGSVDAVAAGAKHTCAALAGGVMCWGSNSSGQLGDSRGSAISQSLSAISAIASGSGATSVVAGALHSCAAVNGGVKCWGNNNSGQIGNNQVVVSYVPVVAIPSGGNATDIAAGAAHTCTVINGGLECWGDNSRGQLADPVTVPGRYVHTAIPYVAFSLNVSKLGNGAGTVTSAASDINCGALCSLSAQYGNVSTLSATPSFGSNFAGWSGASCTGTGSCVVTLTSTRNLVATFPLNQYAIATSVTTAGGLLSCSPNPVNHGSNSTCTATPAASYSLTGFGGACAGAACILNNVTGARSVSASFAFAQSITGFAPASSVVLGAGPMTLAATGGASGSPVLFATASLSSICTASGNQLSFIGAGTCVVTANQAGGNGFNPAIEVMATILVKAASTLTVNGPVSSVYGSSASFIATVTNGVNATGSVAFLADGNAIAGCSAQSMVSDVATCATSNLTIGVHSVSATYSGDNLNQGVTASAISHTVNRASQTLIFGAQLSASQRFVANAMFSLNPLAIPGASSSTVIYSVAPANVCSIAGTTVTIVGLGNCAITANQAGDTNYRVALPVTQTVTVAGTLDIDLSPISTRYKSLTVGVLISRYLAGATGTALTTGALGSSASRTSAQLIWDYLESIRPLLDIDGNGVVDKKTDGVLILRYLLGLRGSALTASVISTSAPLPSRSLPADIEAYMRSLMP